MSASLVGSEMCIRDSGQPCRRQPGGPLASWPIGCAACQGRPAGRNCRCSVSYTHLTLPTICSV
eukprot:4933887-Alexandrium_andersonii.AAC.1